LSLVAVEHQGNAESERTSCGGTRLATIEKTPVCTGHQVYVRRVHSEQMSGARESLQIAGLEWRVAIHRRKLGKRRGPGSLLKQHAPLVE
jgi:hypothetical protein